MTLTAPPRPPLAPLPAPAGRARRGRTFGGSTAAGRTLFNEVGDDGDGPVGDSIDVKVLGLSQKDARIAETRARETGCL